MSASPGFQLDVGHHFPHLAHAPIVEAVIHWQASPGKPLERQHLKDELVQRFPGYALHAQQHVQAALSASAEGVETRQRTLWGGFRLASADEKYVCRVRPNGVEFSRLAPYQDWETFVAEALRFWDSFLELTDSGAIDRLGVRFINQIAMKSNETPSDLVNEMPLPLESIGLPSETLFRQDILEPTPLYRISLVRAIQPAQPPAIRGKSLIVDIDVFTAAPTKADKAAVDQRLSEMHFLKNLVFFEFLKEPEKRFGEQRA